MNSAQVQKHVLCVCRMSDMWKSEQASIFRVTLIWSLWSMFVLVSIRFACVVGCSASLQPCRTSDFLKNNALHRPAFSPVNSKRKQYLKTSVCTLQNANYIDFITKGLSYLKHMCVISITYTYKFYAPSLTLSKTRF